MRFYRLSLLVTFAFTVSACGSNSNDTGGEMTGGPSGATTGSAHTGSSGALSSSGSASGAASGTATGSVSGATSGAAASGATAGSLAGDGSDDAGFTTGSDVGSTADAASVDSSDAASQSDATAGDGAPGDTGSASGSAKDASPGDASGSASGSTGSSGRNAACNFASGLNVAWINFANDVPNPQISAFQTLFKNTHSVGGRVVRWWFHTNGTVTPGYQNGVAQNLPQSHIDGVKSILDAAHSNGVAINLSLWSFDMLQGNENISSAVRAGNTSLLTNDSARQKYIDNYLTPLVKALKGNPGLYSYEIFNEPEGMTPAGWTVSNGGTSVPESAVQRTVNWLASAIHEADPNVLVTNGAQTFQTCSNVSGKTNDYSDSALRGAGGKQDGTLDFYEVHYYTQNGISVSPFKNAASHWGLDKKLVMGEFYAADTDGVAAKDTFTYLYSNGYSGAWAWAYEGSMDSWPSIGTPIQSLYNAHGDVGSCP